MDSATAEATCKKLVSVLALDAGFEGITASALESLTRVFENCKQRQCSPSKSIEFGRDNALQTLATTKSKETQQDTANNGNVASG
jgi:hypothetical protein